MANEVSVRSSLTINNGSLSYSSRPTSYQADATGAKGPTPGALTISTSGTEIDLTQLTTPGFCRISNLDPSTSNNYVEYGVYVGSTFYALGELLPGEFVVLRLYRDMGVAGTDFHTLMLNAVGSTVDCSVEAFEK